MMLFRHAPFKWEFHTEPEHKMIYAVDVKGKFRGFVWADNRLEAARKIRRFGWDAKLYGLPIVWKEQTRRPKAREA